MAKVRVATVKATGERYLVSGLHLPRDPRQARKAFCWGEVVGIKGGHTVHGPGKTYLLDAWWLILFPGLAILVASLSFYLAGDALREAAESR